MQRIVRCHNGKRNERDANSYPGIGNAEGACTCGVNTLNPVVISLSWNGRHVFISGVEYVVSELGRRCRIVRSASPYFVVGGAESWLPIEEHAIMIRIVTDYYIGWCEGYSVL